jgi:hypothetical protein
VPAYAEARRLAWHTRSRSHGRTEGASTPVPPICAIVLLARTANPRNDRDGADEPIPHIHRLAGLLLPDHEGGYARSSTGIRRHVFVTSQLFTAMHVAFPRRTCRLCLEYSSAYLAWSGDMHRLPCRQTPMRQPRRTTRSLASPSCTCRPIHASMSPDAASIGDLPHRRCHLGRRGMSPHSRRSGDMLGDPRRLVSPSLATHQVVHVA